MNTDISSIPHRLDGVTGATRTPSARVVAACAAALIAVAASVAAIHPRGDDATPSITRSRPPAEVQAITQDLIERGLVPAEALEPATPTDDAVLRDLVERGLVPAQAIDG